MTRVQILLFHPLVCCCSCFSFLFVVVILAIRLWSDSVRGDGSQKALPSCIIRPESKYFKLIGLLLLLFFFLLLLLSCGLGFGSDSVRGDGSQKALPSRIIWAESKCTIGNSTPAYYLQNQPLQMSDKGWQGTFQHQSSLSKQYSTVERARGDISSCNRSAAHPWATVVLR